eukprot:CAMPEP_0197028112 /NCGR_PEP_ID=MMETSP1384-20130603/7888_1 /TAXON_ID=29189 /ORGANISM="Ammonia sp." /LENGTH=798 /DNA_ID=CAMNT_0042457065 /DNA_START=18 /DNA_END=2414 /DNA_ORIENTATION=-
MTGVDPMEEQIAELRYEANEVITSWLGTTASQIFFMQLGFLCYEVGFVQSVWAPSIILKNIEDTFVGILTYMAFTHTLATSKPSIGGIISVPTNPFLIGIDPSLHKEVFVESVYATTCATIISGAVLERMKNKAYVLYCFLVILIQYSFIAHWVWNEDGWLRKLGFVDGAGAIVIHCTGGIAGAVAAAALGARRGMTNKDGSLKEIETAHRPVLVAIGAFVLWYGWFAFNISSPVASNLGIGAAVGTTGLVTCIAPTCASCSALLLMYLDFAKLSYDNLLGAMLAGLVSITGTCYTCNVWEACIIGFFASFVYFLAMYTVRNKFGVDDPLHIISIHACCGLYSCIMEGVFANNVMGNPGLVYGGYKHFGVQILGVAVVLLFNFLCSSFIFRFLLQRVIFKNTNIRVSILDTYLGISLFSLSNKMALEEMLENRSNLAKQMSFRFHSFTMERFNNEQFDFLVAIHIYRDYVHFQQDPQKIAKAIINIIETYVLPESSMCVNVSGTQRAQLIRIRNQLKYELHDLESGITPSERPKANRRKNIKYSTRRGLHGTNEVGEAIDIPETMEVEIDGVSTTASSRWNSRRNSLLQMSQQRGAAILNRDIIGDKTFDAAHEEVFKIILPVFAQFLSRFDKKQDTIKESVRLPFQVHADWILEWDEELVKQGDERLGGLAEAAAGDLENYYEDITLLMPNTTPAGDDNNNHFANPHALIAKIDELELVNPMQSGKARKTNASPSTQSEASRSKEVELPANAGIKYVIHKAYNANGKEKERDKEPEIADTPQQALGGLDQGDDDGAL